MRIEEPGGPDAVTINPDKPVYQVNIFARLSVPFDVPEEQRGFIVSEWKVHDADAPDVLAWAAEKADGADYTVSVAAAEDPGHNYLLRLYGDDPMCSGPPSEVYVTPNGPVDGF